MSRPLLKKNNSTKQITDLQRELLVFQRFLMYMYFNVNIRVYATIMQTIRDQL